MANRTFAVGDIHGDLAALEKAISKIPNLDAQDTMVLMGDYLDRGEKSAQVIDFVRKELPKRVPGKLVCLRGNHEDGWLRVASGGWPEFVIPIANGCLATLRSYRGQPCEEGEIPTKEELITMQHGEFLPDDVVDWMNALPYFLRRRARDLRPRRPRGEGRPLAAPLRDREPDAAPLGAHDALLPGLPRQARGLRPHRDREPSARALELHARGSARHVGR